MRPRLSWLFIASLVALAGACGKGTASGSCTSSADCGSGYECAGGSCLPTGGGHPGDGRSAGDGDAMGGDDGDGDGYLGAGGAGGAGADGGDGGDAGDAGDAGDSGPADIPDTLGPLIEIVSPGPYQLVSGAMHIQVTVTDRSGVDPASVAITIANDPSLTFLSPITQSQGTYRTDFDTRQLPYMNFPLIEVTAADKLGNVSSTGYEFALDNVPPIVSFTSPMAQLRRLTSTSYECSQPFPILGGTELKHGDVITPNYTFEMGAYIRARIHDQANAGAGAAVPMAGIDNETTKLYILTKSGIQAGHKLVVGTGSGTTCLGIAPESEPAQGARVPDQAIVQALVPVASGGAGDFVPMNLSAYPCKLPGADTAAPLLLCDSGAAPVTTYWVPWIYVLNRYDPADPVTCAGGAFDFRNLEVDGEACLAMTAVDNLGNRGVSQPIAICVDRDNSGDCAAFDAVKADAVAAGCSDGCVAPSFDPTTEVWLL